MALFIVNIIMNKTFAQIVAQSNKLISRENSNDKYSIEIVNNCIVNNTIIILKPYSCTIFQLFKEYQQRYKQREYIDENKLIVLREQLSKYKFHLGFLDNKKKIKKSAPITSPFFGNCGKPSGLWYAGGTDWYDWCKDAGFRYEDKLNLIKFNHGFKLLVVVPDNYNESIVFDTDNYVKLSYKEFEEKYVSYGPNYLDLLDKDEALEIYNSRNKNNIFSSYEAFVKSQDRYREEIINWKKMITEDKFDGIEYIYTGRNFFTHKYQWSTGLDIHKSGCIFNTKKITVEQQLTS